MVCLVCIIVGFFEKQNTTFEDYIFKTYRSSSASWEVFDLRFPSMCDSRRGFKGSKRFLVGEMANKGGTLREYTWWRSNTWRKNQAWDIRASSFNFLTPREASTRNRNDQETFAKSWGLWKLSLRLQGSRNFRQVFRGQETFAKSSGIKKLSLCLQESRKSGWAIKSQDVKDQDSKD